MERGDALASSAKDELGLDTALLARLKEFARRREENENLKKRLGNLKIKVQEQLEAKRNFLDSSCENLKHENASLLTRITNFESILTALESIPDSSISDKATTSNTHLSADLKGKGHCPSNGKTRISIGDSRMKHITNDSKSLASIRPWTESPSKSKTSVSMEDNNLNHLTSDWGTKGNNTSTRSWGKSAVLRSWGAETVEKRSHSEDITVVKTWGEPREEVVSDPAKNHVSRTIKPETPLGSETEYSQGDLIPEKGKVRLGQIVYDSAKSISKMLSSIQQKYAKQTPSTGLIHLALEDEEIIKACLKFDPKANDEDVQNVYSGNFPTYEYSRCTSSTKTYWNKRDRADMYSYFEQFGTFPLNFGLQRKFLQYERLSRVCL